MSPLAWILLGVIAGFLASKLLGSSGESLPRDMLLGTLGAAAGAWLVDTFGLADVAGLSVYSLIIAIVGAGLLLVGYHALRTS